jgi:hypothetical protein
VVNERTCTGTYRISAIRSSIAYHANGPYATPLHHPNISAGAMNACACRWSVIGILLSLKGGAMKPMRNCESSWCNGDDVVKFGLGLEGVGEDDGKSA